MSCAWDEKSYQPILTRYDRPPATVHFTVHKVLMAVLRRCHNWRPQSWDAKCRSCDGCLEGWQEGTQTHLSDGSFNSHGVDSGHWGVPSLWASWWGKVQKIKIISLISLIQKTNKLQSPRQFLQCECSIKTWCTLAVRRVLWSDLSSFILTIAPPRRCWSYIQRSFPPVFVLTGLDVCEEDNTSCEHKQSLAAKVTFSQHGICHSQK